MDWLDDGCDALARIVGSLFFVGGRPVPLEVVDAVAEFMEIPLMALESRGSTPEE